MPPLVQGETRRLLLMHLLLMDLMVVLHISGELMGKILLMEYVKGSLSVAKEGVKKHNLMMQFFLFH